MTIHLPLQPTNNECWLWLKQIIVCLAKDNSERRSRRHLLGHNSGFTPIVDRRPELSALLLFRDHVSSSPLQNSAEQTYPNMEYVSPPSSPARSPTPPLWTPPPELSWGSDEDEDEDSGRNDCKFKI